MAIAFAQIEARSGGEASLVLHPFDVAAGGERRARTGDDHHRELGVACETLHGRDEGRDLLDGRERVAHLGTVEGERRDAAATLNEDGVLHHA